MAKVTIDDISRHTGLSRGTVSRALNDRPDISEKTKQRVLEACRTLNYIPSHAARSLATGKALACAVLLDDLDSVFAAAFMRGVLGRAETAGYAVHVAELGTTPERQLDVIRHVVSERIDGVLASAPLASAAARLLVQTLERRPLLSCAPLEGITCDVLVPDQVESGRLAARHVLEKGHRAILYVHAPQRPWSAERLAGFREVCSQRGLHPDQAIIELSEQRPLSGHAEAALLDRLRQAEAVIATDDFLAIEIASLSVRAGRRPGLDLAIMGQGNERAGARVWPPLTTTDFNGKEIGRRAMEMLLGRINKTRLDATQTTPVAPMLVVRDSTQRLL